MKSLLSVLFVSILCVGGDFPEKAGAGVPPAALNRLKPVKAHELIAIFEKNGIECSEESVRSKDQIMGVTRYYKCSSSDIMKFSSDVESLAAIKTQSTPDMYIKKQYIVVTKEKGVQKALIDQGFDPIQT